jgi:hypothetical protein
MFNVLRRDAPLCPLDEEVVEVVFVPNDAGAGGLIHDVSIYQSGSSVYTGNQMARPA